MRPQTLALWLSAGVPCIAYIVTASAYAYWLDSGEFVAAAVQLDIAHPPGHPLSALYGKLLSLLPFGSLSFRVAFGQALATAAAAALHCKANAAALRGMSLDPRVTWALALFGAWLSALSYGLWFQAVRPEVYALQTLCVALVYERLMHASTSADGHGHALLTAAFALGLSLTNHHFISLLLVPAFVPELVRVMRGRRWDQLGCACLLGAIGLSTYVYLPLRAASAPPMNFGDPSNWERLLWVVSGRVYSREPGFEAPESMTTRMLDVIGLWYDDVGWWPLALACLGLYLGLRVSETRKPAIVCVLVFVADAPARALLGSVRSNPDILGYLAPSYLAIGTLATFCLGAVAWLLDAHDKRSWGYVAWLAPLCVLSLIPKTAARASLADFTATDELDELRLRTLPPRALVLESSPQTVFRTFELGAVEGARPDVVRVALPFLRYPNAANQLLAQQPSLAALVHSYQAHHDHFTEASPMLGLARERNVFVELDTRVDPQLYPVLCARGVYAEVAPGQSAEPGLRDFYAFQRARLSTQQDEPETSKQLLWIHFMNALQLGTLGHLGQARGALAQALALQPTEQRLQALQKALAVERPLDASAFLRF
ncbi:MAG TPA: DUF2723 domain-containing protein [Polyangiales bacterium]|nr:DUF2723 domain-containing protein [Polyangiales bacterium]